MHAIDCKMNYEMRIERVSNVPVVHLNSVFVRPLRHDCVLGIVARYNVSDTLSISHISTMIPSVGIEKERRKTKGPPSFLNRYPQLLELP